MSGILLTNSGIAMNMLAVPTVDYNHQTGSASGSGMEGKSTHVSKRKDRESEADGPTSPPSAAPSSSKRPKPNKASSTDSKEHLITGTYVKLDLQKKTLTLIQDPQPLDKYTSYLSLMARFQEWLMEQPLDTEITVIPQEYYPLIAMIGHEHSTVHKARLVEYVGAALKPTDVGDGEVAKISSAALTAACTTLFTPQSYGIHPSDFPRLSTDVGGKEVKVPAPLALRRWEVSDWTAIPQGGVAGRGFKARDVMVERRRVRELAREEVQRIVGGLEEGVVRCLLGIGGEKPSSGKVGNGETENGTTILQAKLKAKPEKPKSELTPTQLAERETKEAEKRAREAERLRRVEAKAKKEQEVAKSKAMMMGFFKKPVVGPSGASPVGKTVQLARAKSRSESVEVECLSSEFQAAFRPFYARGNVEVAPVNRFTMRPGVVADEDASQWQAKDILSSFIKHASTKTPLPIGRPPLSRKRTTTHEQSRSGLVCTPKTEPLFCTIPDLVDRAQEAEDPRLVYSHLSDHAKFPRKVFKFDEDLRPPYQGTWTKPSWFVGPRTPFALDPNIDYAIDEGLDWEPENLDEGAMDVEEDEEPESEEDEDMGSWLASDDELDEEPSRSSTDPFGGSDQLGMPVVKPKANKEAKLPPRRFEKLVQFSKGPVWESGLGEVAWKGFEQYRICVLNDTPLGGIDPFTWQAPEHVKLSPPVDKTPAAPPRPSATAASPASAAPITPTVTPKPVVPRPIPKANLTPPQLADFLRMIDGSDKLKRALVVELSGRFPSAGTQSSIKAKLEDVATKANTKGSVWVVKPDAWAEAQVPAPVSRV